MGGSCPQYARAILMQAANDIARKSAPDSIGCHYTSIAKLVQPVLRSRPQRAIAILRKRVYGIGRQTVSRSQCPKILTVESCQTMVQRAGPHNIVTILQDRSGLVAGKSFADRIRHASAIHKLVQAALGAHP